MNEEARIWENKAAEVEQKRVAAENKLNMLYRQCDQMKRALDELRQFVNYHLEKQTREDRYAEESGLPRPKREKYQTQDLAALKYMMSVPYNARTVSEEPPDNPQTNDHYFDGQTHWWFYLGNWHEERKHE